MSHPGDGAGLLLQLLVGVCPAAPQSSEGDAAAASLHPCPCHQPSGMFLGFLGQGREPRDVQEALCVGKQRRLLQQKGGHLTEAMVLFPVETPTQKMKSSVRFSLQPETNKSSFPK